MIASAVNSYLQNKAKVLERESKRYREKRDELIEYQKRWARANAELVKAYNKRRYHKNKLDPSRQLRWRESRRKYKRNKRRKDRVWAAKQNLRNRMSLALRGIKVGSEFWRLLGCDLDTLKHHLQSKFVTGMTWYNYGVGKGTWQIDHIFPISRIDFTDKLAVAKVFHYTNLQPLWSLANRQKNNVVLMSL